MGTFAISYLLPGTYKDDTVYAERIVYDHGKPWHPEDLHAVMTAHESLWIVPGTMEDDPATAMARGMQHGGGPLSLYAEVWLETSSTPANLRRIRSELGMPRN